MKKNWLEYFEKDKEGLREVASWDEFEDWENSRRPEILATSDFSNALVASYCDDMSLKGRFIEKSANRVARALLEEKYLCENARGYYPVNRGELYRIKVYAEALKTNELDSSCLIQAANDYEKYALEGTWNDYKQSVYIQSMMMRLIAGDLEPLFESLKLKISFKDNPLLFKLIFGLVLLIQKEQDNLPVTTVSQPKTCEKLFGFFNLVRSPDFQLDEFITIALFRFEYAAILYKYFVSKTGEIDWNEVINMISE